MTAVPPRPAAPDCGSLQCRARGCQGCDRPAAPDEYAGHRGSCRIYYAEHRCTCGHDFPCTISGYPEREHVGDGEMIHDFRPAAPDSPAAADSGTPASPRRTVTDGTTDSVAIHRSAQQETNTAPDATAVDGLREVERLMAFVREWDDGERNYWAIGEDITDLLRWWLPALRDVLAAAARDAEKVRGVEGLADWLRYTSAVPIHRLDVVDRIHIALDGTP